jgi:hypothetical protein
LILANNQRLTTIYEVMLQDCISRGKIPNFVRLRQLSDLQIKDRLTYIHNRFLFTFPTQQSITLNKIFDNLSALQRQLDRFEKKLQSFSTESNQKHSLSINTHIHIPATIIMAKVEHDKR